MSARTLGPADAVAAARGAAVGGTAPAGARDWPRRALWVAGSTALLFLALGVVLTVRLAGSADLDAERVGLLPLIALLGAASYMLRFARWHLLVRRVAPRLRLAPSLRIYLAGFALGLTPGRVGEFGKFVMLRDETGVPEAVSAPVFPLERATEAASFTALALAGAALAHVHLGRTGAGSLAAIAAIPLLGIGGALLRRVGRKRLAADDNMARPLRQALLGVRSVTGLPTLGAALACALAARCCDATLFWLAATAVGAPIPLAGAALAFGLAGLAGGLLLLPAGVGAVEGSLVATASAFGADPETALSAALLARVFTLWVWIPVGLWLAFRGLARRVEAT